MLRASFAALLIVIAVAACSPSRVAPAPSSGVESLGVEVVVERPHDATAYTEGLQLDSDKLYESTGLQGQSTLREVDPVDGDVKRLTQLEDEYFGEGIAVVDDRIIQLTWQNGVALVYGLPELTQIGSFSYEGEGWGLCDDGSRLVMSDGSETLTFRDRTTFDVLGTVAVRDESGPVAALNELECVDGQIYANVYQSDTIVRVDSSSGAVTAIVNAAAIHPVGDKVGVMNGIAYDDDMDTFLLTGKNWPTLYEVRFAEQ